MALWLVEGGGVVLSQLRGPPASAPAAASTPAAVTFPPAFPSPRPLLLSWRAARPGRAPAAASASSSSPPSSSSSSSSTLASSAAAAVAETEGLKVVSVPTKPYEGQKTGTSGLRKKVKVFQQENYLANWIQSLFNSLPTEDYKNGVLVLGGDGRYFNREAAQIIIKIAAGNGVRKILVGRDGYMSTPAVSAVIRKQKANGGFIMSASHNPGGPEYDWGIKFNYNSGQPAPESITDKIYANTLSISEIKTAEIPDIDLFQVGAVNYGNFRVEVVDPVTDYLGLMESVFDFELIRSLLLRSDFRFVFDAMHAVTGAYAKPIFVDRLGAGEGCILNGVPLEDFGHGHPDPNLTYAKELVDIMNVENAPDLGAASDGYYLNPRFQYSESVHNDGEVIQGTIDVIRRLSRSAADRVDAEREMESYRLRIGTYADPDMQYAVSRLSPGDGDRNMILGRQFFVTPSDSVAIIAANAQVAIPYFKDGCKGLARSMPTSGALDRVAIKLNLPFYEVPTGWKFFGNLMDAGKLSICGEESFGTGSDHIREKDGIWAVLAWLSILAHRNKDKNVGEKLVSVSDVVKEHWATYGRNFFSRYDYEECESEGANQMIHHLREIVAKSKPCESYGNYTLQFADDFNYTDPVDGSVASKQGIRFVFADGSRLIFRLSGTGSAGATIRIYMEQFEPDVSRHGMDAQAALKPLIDLALTISKLKEFTSRDKPTVIT